MGGGRGGGWLEYVHFFTPPHVNGGVLCFNVGRPCVCPSVRRPSVVRTSALRFRSITSVSIVNGQISIICHTVMALVNGQKMVFGL